MPYILDFSNYHHASKTFEISGARYKSGEYRLSFAMISREFPDYVKEQIDRMSRIDFQVTDFLTVEGEIVQQDDGQCVPLHGLSACWTSDDTEILTDLLKKFYIQQRGEAPQPHTAKVESSVKGFKPLQRENMVKLLQGKKILVFTGAGISMASDVPDLDGVIELHQQIFTPPEQYLHDLIENNTADRIELAKEFQRAFTAKEPNPIHWYIKELCTKHGFDLATGNIDDLHEKTGITPIYQTNFNRVEIPNIEAYDVILTVGLSEEGMGIVAEEFKAGNGSGFIIAINLTAPLYLDKNDYFVEGNCEEILRIVMERNNQEL